MKTIKEILKNYKEYETILDDRFGERFADYLTEDEMLNINLELEEEYKTNWKPKEWTLENILNQLKEDVLFAMEKMSDERGISAVIMHDVVKSWMKVLEDTELVNLLNNDYSNYGKEHIRKVAKKYNIDISEVDY